MWYRDKDRVRRRESTLTEVWDEAQKCLREHMGSEKAELGKNNSFGINGSFGGRSRARTADLLLVRQAL